MSAFDKLALPTEGVADAVKDLYADAGWYEVQANCKPGDFYRGLQTHVPAGAVLLFHHFYEPWHPTGPVFRLLIAAEAEAEVFRLLDSWDAVVGYGRWDREDDDRDLYGEEWFPYAMQFFMGSSMLAGHPHGRWMADKLVHCVLNAHALTRRQEMVFGLRFAWRSLIIEPWLWFRALRTGKKWWER